MNVALDATPLTVPTGGIRRYVEQLHTALVAEYPDDRFLLVSDQPPYAPLAGSFSPRWWSFGLNQVLDREQVQVFHGTDFSVPYRRARPAVMTVHDLSPWRYADASPRVRRRTPWLIRLNRATLYITPSEAIRREMSSYFRVPLDRIVATPLAASPEFRPTPPESSLSASPYFLFVGTVEPRKGLDRILPLMPALHAETGAELWIAGRIRTPLPPTPGVKLIGAVPDVQLPSLYSGAAAVLVPSLYEGFGLPVVEAMSCGAAVFTSSDPALVEAGGEAAVKLDSPEQWCDAMLAALKNPEWIAGRRQASLQRALDFSWRYTARLTYEAYAEAQRRA